MRSTSTFRYIAFDQLISLMLAFLWTDKYDDIYAKIVQIQNVLRFNRLFEEL